MRHLPLLLAFLSALCEYSSPRDRAEQLGSGTRENRRQEHRNRGVKPTRAIRPRMVRRWCEGCNFLGRIICSAITPRGGHRRLLVFSPCWSPLAAPRLPEAIRGRCQRQIHINKVKGMLRASSRRLCNDSVAGDIHWPPRSYCSPRKGQKSAKQS